MSEIGPTSCINRLTMPRAGRPLMRLVSAVASALRVRKRLPVRRGNLRLGAMEVCRPELDASGPERKRRDDPAHVRYSACRNDREIDGIHHLGDQRQRADLPGDVFDEEHAAMAAGLKALRDDGIDPTLGEPARLRNRGRRTQHDRTGSLNARYQFPRRKAEMEAHDLRPRLLYHGAESAIERRTDGERRRRRGIEPELAIIGHKTLAPARFARRVGRRRRMTEEVHVERLARAAAELRDLITQLVGREHRGGQRPKPARLRHRRGKLEIHRAGHGRLDDRKINPEEVKQTSIRPHNAWVPEG